MTEERPRHKLWIATAARLLATPAPSLPADDDIDQIIVWDQATVRAMIARIEGIPGRGWIPAMCRERAFCIQSFGSTPLATIRTALDAFHAGHSPEIHQSETKAA